LPEIHVNVGALGAASEYTVEFQRRKLENIDVWVGATLGRGEVTVPRMSLRKRQTTFVNHHCSGPGIAIG